MTTVFNSMTGDTGALQNDPYNAALEVIAPGIGQCLTQIRRRNQPWDVTLEMAMPFLHLTPEQRQLLQIEILNKRSGVPAPSLGEVQTAQIATAQEIAAKPKADFVKTISYVGAAVTVLRWITG